MSQIYVVHSHYAKESGIFPREYNPLMSFKLLSSSRMNFPTIDSADSIYVDPDMWVNVFIQPDPDLNHLD